MGDLTPPSVSPLTDSPWFWLMLFSLAGLAAVATIGPKFEQREQSLETKFHARERATGREDVVQPAEEAPAEQPHWDPIFTLGPIAAALAIAAVVAMFGVLRFHQRRLAELRQREDTQS